MAIVIMKPDGTPRAVFSGDGADSAARRFLADRANENLIPWCYVTHYADGRSPAVPYPIGDPYLRGSYTPHRPHPEVEPKPYCIIGRTAQKMSRTDRNWYSTLHEAEDHAEELIDGNEQTELLAVKIMTIIRRIAPRPPPIERVRVK